jgi:hypothetical protein
MTLNLSYRRPKSHDGELALLFIARAEFTSILELIHNVAIPSSFPFSSSLFCLLDLPFFAYILLYTGYAPREISVGYGIQRVGCKAE